MYIGGLGSRKMHLSEFDTLSELAIKIEELYDEADQITANLETVDSELG